MSTTQTGRQTKRKKEDGEAHILVDKISILEAAELTHTIGRGFWAVQKNAKAFLSISWQVGQG
jgi:hypothetical protein